MIKVTATKLRNNLFKLLSKVAKGETITIHRNGELIAMLVPVKRRNWRDRIRKKPKLLVTVDKAFAPMEDIWEHYL